MTPASISHELFSYAVIKAFRDVYGQDETEIVEVPSEGVFLKKANEGGAMIAYVQNQKEDLLSWGWLYGQTPEFTQSLSKPFSWGYVVSLFTSKTVPCHDPC